MKKILFLLLIILFSCQPDPVDRATGTDFKYPVRANGGIAITPPLSIGAVNITATGAQFNFLSDVTGLIQAQLNGKAATSHTQAQSTITGLPDSLLNHYTKAQTNTRLNSKLNTADTNHLSDRINLKTSIEVVSQTVGDSLREYFSDEDVEIGIALSDSMGYDPGNYLPRQSASVLATSLIKSTTTTSLFIKAMNTMGTLDIKAFPILCPNPLSLGSTALSDGGEYWIAFYITEPTTITGVRFLMGATVGNFTPDNENGISFYSVSGETYTQEREVLDATIFSTSAANGIVTVPFGTPYSAVEGVYYVVVLYNESGHVATPTMHFHQSINNYVRYMVNTNNKLAGLATGVTAFPDSEVAGDVSTTSIMPGVWLY
jgi:hypothetical protein